MFCGKQHYQRLYWQAVARLATKKRLYPFCSIHYLLPMSVTAILASERRKQRALLGGCLAIPIPHATQANLLTLIAGWMAMSLNGTIVAQVAFTSR
jgi:hypothetical protein